MLVNNIFFSESGPLNHMQLLEDGLPAMFIAARNPSRRWAAYPSLTRKD
jgi:hypothetical protein